MPDSPCRPQLRRVNALPTHVLFENYPWLTGCTRRLKLLSRDRRSPATYDAIGVDYELV